MVKVSLGGLVPRYRMYLRVSPVQRAPYSLIDPGRQGVPVLERLVIPKPGTIAGMPMPEAKRRRMA